MNCLVKNHVVEVRDAFRSEDYSFTIDWLNIRLDLDNVDALILALCGAFKLDISDFSERKGVCYYSNGYYLNTLSYSAFTINYNVDAFGRVITEGSKGQTYGILLSISGDGCRFLNNLVDDGLNKLLDIIAPFNPVCTRIDTACDIFDSNNCVVPMIQTFADYAYDRENALIDFNCNLNRMYTDANGERKYRPWVTFNLNYDDIVQGFTRNVTIGGRDCKKGTLQLYNKRVEMQNGRLSEVSEAVYNSLGVTDYWWRLEYRCKSFSQKVFLNLLENRDVVQAFLCAANEMGSFVIAGDSHNIHLSETCIEWLSFINFIENLIASDIHFVQLPLVNIPYIGTHLERTKKFHLDNISSNDTIHFMLLMLDSEYRSQWYYKLKNQYYLNPRLKPALLELQKEYGYKLEDLSSAVWGQASMF